MPWFGWRAPWRLDIDWFATLLVVGVLVFVRLRTKTPASDRLALRAYAVAAVCLAVFGAAEVVAHSMPSDDGSGASAISSSLDDISKSLEFIGHMLPSR